MELLYILLAKVKILLLGAFGGSIIYLFEIKTSKAKFSILRCLTSSIMIGFLTEMSRLAIFGWDKEIASNEEKTIVLSILSACFLYLLIPFILKEENREEFIRFVLSKFGYERIKK